MELLITRIVYIETDMILDTLKKHPKISVEDAVADYIGNLDDSEWYLIGDEDIEKIVKEIKRQLAKKR